MKQVVSESADLIEIGLVRFRKETLILWQAVVMTTLIQFLLPVKWTNNRIR